MVSAASFARARPGTRHFSRERSQEQALFARPGTSSSLRAQEQALPCAHFARAHSNPFETRCSTGPTLASLAAARTASHPLLPQRQGVGVSIPRNLAAVRVALHLREGEADDVPPQVVVVAPQQLPDQRRGRGGDGALRAHTVREARRVGGGGRGCGKGGVGGVRASFDARHPPRFFLRRFARAFRSHAPCASAAP